MRKGLGLGCVLLFLMVVVAACGGNKNNEAASTTAASKTPAASASSETVVEPSETPSERTIEYLGETYTVPGNVERIVITGSIEAHEDALVLDVHPVGAVTFAGAFPERFASITDQAESIGEKREPNFETILKLKPDVILGTSKFPEETNEKLKKIATTIPVSHIATNWEANLLLLGELSGKQEQAAQAITKYKAEAEAAKLTLADKLKGKQVAAVRIRAGEIFTFDPSVFVNPILYNDLGLDVPATIAASKSQEAISIEQLAVMNPDYLFIQFSTEENVDTQNALQDVLDNPIVKAIHASKEDHVFVNVIDPLAEGGPAWSRTNFLAAALELLTK
jgi:iron complex transport system substrate-binding protein